ncbi:MAG: hypothetical protein FJ297_04320 [Planctomycetes bacterium]|nr:hypothetical protein [Planctomycetota bacterium]
MTDERVTVRRIAWTEVIPCWILFRSFRISLELRMLLVALVGLSLAPVGRRAIEWVLARPETRAEATSAPSGADALGRNPAPDTARMNGLSAGIATNRAAAARSDYLPFAIKPIERFLRPWSAVVRPPDSFRATVILVLCGLWSLCVWALAGGVLTRMAVVRIARDERVGFMASIRHVATKFGSYVGAPLLPIGAIVLGLFLLSAVGWLTWTNIGYGLVALAWPLVLAGSLLLMVIIAGVAIGWPMMWVALGAEPDADSWDAVSRGYAYTLHHPLKLVAYAAVALVLGVVGGMIVSLFVELTLSMVQAYVGWGDPSAEWLWSAFAGGGGVDAPSFPVNVVRGWNTLLRSIVDAYAYSYFFTAAAAIYLLARRDTNHTMIEDVFVTSDDDTLRLPDLPPPPSAP